MIDSLLQCQTTSSITSCDSYITSCDPHSTSCDPYKYTTLHTRDNGLFHFTLHHFVQLTRNSLTDWLRQGSDQLLVSQLITLFSLPQHPLHCLLYIMPSQETLMQILSFKGYVVFLFSWQQHFLVQMMSPTTVKIFLSSLLFVYPSVVRVCSCFVVARQLADVTHSMTAHPLNAAAHWSTP